jgi:hypothetical protein
MEKDAAMSNQVLLPIAIHGVFYQVIEQRNMVIQSVFMAIIFIIDLFQLFGFLLRKYQHI